MKALVAGAAGFIGSHLVDRMVAEGIEVVGVDSFDDYYAPADKERNLAAALAHDRFTLVRADLCRRPIEPLLEGVDVVVNLAATPGMLLGWDRFERYQRGNQLVAQRLAAACAAVGVGHLVHASTSSVYGEVATGPESSPTRPVSPYGVTKLGAEHVVRAYGATEGLAFTILRYFSVYGPRQRPDMAYRRFCEQLLAGEPLEIHGDGRQSRSNTHVDDCVAATLAAVGRPPDGSTINVGGGAEIALLDAVAVLAEALGVEPTLVHRPPRPGDQRRTVADTALAHRLLGWSPTVDVVEGLAREAAWVRSRRDPDPLSPAR